MAFESVKVDVISRSLIKPSSSTPDHLRHLKLSFLDQIQPAFYIPILFLYEADELKGLTQSTNHGNLRTTLQESLSATLTSFYPVAGVLDAGEVSVICNDDGVEFIEAKAHCRIEDIVLQKELGQVLEYFPVNPFSPSDKLLFVQINYFDCGGIAVGVCLSHTIADGWSMFEFMNSWAATCRGEKWGDSPYKFGPLGQNVPARDLSELNLSLNLNSITDQYVRKIFVFEKDQLTALKRAAASTGGDSIADPTQVEALTAFIWKSSIENYMLEGKKRFAATHFVTIRSRGNLSFQDVIGNAFITTTAFIDQSGSGGGNVDAGPPSPPTLPNLVRELRKAIRKVNREYIEKIQTDPLVLKEFEYIIDLMRRGEMEFFNFNSWTRFPIYDVDFGWGRPVAITLPFWGLNHYAHFMPTKDGQGIEAWVTMPPHHMESLENRYKLI